MARKRPGNPEVYTPASLRDLLEFWVREGHRSHEVRLLLGMDGGIAVPYQLCDQKLVTERKEFAEEILGSEVHVMHPHELPDGALSADDERALDQGSPVVVHSMHDRFRRLSQGSPTKPSRLNRINDARQFMLRASLEHIGRLMSDDPAAAKMGKAVEQAVAAVADYTWPLGAPKRPTMKRGAKDGSGSYLAQQWAAGNHLNVYSSFLRHEDPASWVRNSYAERNREIDGERQMQLAFWMTVCRAAILVDGYAEMQLRAHSALSRESARIAPPKEDIASFVGHDRPRLSPDEIIPLAFFGVPDAGYVFRNLSLMHKRFEAAAHVGEICRGNLVRLSDYHCAYLTRVLGGEVAINSYDVNIGPDARLDDNPPLRPLMLSSEAFLKVAMLQYRPAEWWHAALQAPKSNFHFARYVGPDGTTWTAEDDEWVAAAKKTMPSLSCGDESDTVEEDIHEQDVETAEGLVPEDPGEVAEQSQTPNLIFDLEGTEVFRRLARLFAGRWRVELSLGNAWGDSRPFVFLDTRKGICLDLVHIVSHGTDSVEAMVDCALEAAAQLSLIGFIRSYSLAAHDGMDPVDIPDCYAKEWCCYKLNLQLAPRYAERRRLNAEYLATWCTEVDIDREVARAETAATELLNLMDHYGSEVVESDTSNVPGVVTWRSRLYGLLGYLQSWR